MPFNDNKKNDKACQIRNTFWLHAPKPKPKIPNIKTKKNTMTRYKSSTKGVETESSNDMIKLK